MATKCECHWMGTGSCNENATRKLTILTVYDSVTMNCCVDCAARLKAKDGFIVVRDSAITGDSITVGDRMIRVSKSPDGNGSVHVSFPPYYQKEISLTLGELKEIIAFIEQEKSDAHS